MFRLIQSLKLRVRWTGGRQLRDLIPAVEPAIRWDLTDACSGPLWISKAIEVHTR
ncbi:uncharacterized protein METZ01_LOCUS34034 [marine metagenome]|uniref:Uncharacterized protein n=1 Tax=marine metagenome TaxID=408172 RepID=A0A381QQ23_9ZZZZ